MLLCQAKRDPELISRLINEARDASGQDLNERNELGLEKQKQLVE